VDITETGHRYEGHIGMVLIELGLEGADWILLAQDRYQWRSVVNAVMNLRFP
jgi:hypothetical protein